jgi:hypothetical protein
VMLRVRADHQGLGTVGVDVIRSGLGVVLDDEDRGVLPELRMREPLASKSWNAFVYASIRVWSLTLRS